MVTVDRELLEEVGHQGCAFGTCFVPGEWSSLCASWWPCPKLLLSTTPFCHDILPHLRHTAMESAVYGPRTCPK